VEIVKGIFVAPDVLSVEECQEFIARCESMGFEPATLSHFGGAVHRPDVRNNDRVILDDATLAQRLWERIAPLLPSDLDRQVAIGLNERFRFYRYDVGQKFAPHTDGAYHSPTGARSLLTLLLYLNDDYTGGETIVDGQTITPRTGQMLAFRHQLLHESVEIWSGRKYILRSDVMFL
jgi:prolyl 4-hydroxylase